MDCIFCKIVKGEIPSFKVYEDYNTLAFLDIAPVNSGHTLVIPKKHYETIEGIPEDELVELIKTVKRVGKAIKDGLGIEAYNIGLNNGSVAGQIVPHVHFHIMPRHVGDGHKLWTQGQYSEGEANDILNKIKITP